MSSADGKPMITLEEGWVNNIKAKALEPLETLLEEGLTGKKKKLFSNNEYSLVYTVCYDMCTQKQPYNHSEQLYDRQAESMAAYLSSKVLPALRGKHGELLLQEFLRRGENHKIMNQWYAKFFMYLDRFYVKYQSFPTVHECGMNKFKQVVFEGVKVDVTNALLTLINDEREGREIDRHLLKGCVQIYQKMSMDDYESALEKPFLNASREFYGRNADLWIVEESTPSFLKRVEKILEEESQRVSNYLVASTDPKLMQTLDAELLAKRITPLLEREGSGCRVMLTNDLLEDLSRLYRLFHRVANGLDPIADIFKQHILDIGREKIEQRLARLESFERDASKAAGAKDSKDKDNKDKDTVESREGNDDPQFIKDLLFVHGKYTTMVHEQFQSNALFQKALKDAFVELVNQDAGKWKTADLIATFCDRLLKAGSNEKLSDVELEEYLEKSVQLFSYLADKDLFAEIYRNQLARRLLNQRSASDDMERVMISKLKLSCGAQFTAKMEGMLNDLAICTEQSAAFELFCRENPQRTGLGRTELSVQVLTAGHWPQYKSLHEITLPPLMHRCTLAFRDYYEAKTTHRRLTWTYSLGSVLLKGNFGGTSTSGAKRSYDIQVSTLQAVVLMAFNLDALAGASASSSHSSAPGSGGNVVSFTSLMENLNMPEDVLKKTLHSLCMGRFKVLKKLSASAVATSSSSSASASAGESAAAASEGASKDKDAKEDRQMRNTDFFVFNDAFQCPMRKIRIPMASLEDTHNTKRVEEDRTHAIEAAAVRIMKARKTLSHQQLVAEVLAQLSFFRPDAKLVKRRLESLIEREFLDRDPENPSIYRYHA